jgi:hypothetical protein
MVRAIPDLISEYDDELLVKIQEFIRDSRWVSVLQSWREELKGPLGKGQLGAHAKRTARALGGMESIGEIASRLQQRIPRFSRRPLREMQGNKRGMRGLVRQ